MKNQANLCHAHLVVSGMGDLRMRILALTLAAMVAASPIQAATTLTPSGPLRSYYMLEDYDTNHIRQGGFLYETTNYYWDPDTSLIELHDDVGPMQSTITSEHGRRFNFYGATIKGWNFVYFPNTPRPPLIPDEEMADEQAVYDWAYGNPFGDYVEISITGYRNGAQVAEWSQKASDLLFAGKPYRFGPGFRNLDSVLVRYLQPPNAFLAGWEGDLYYGDYAMDRPVCIDGDFYCGEIRITSMTLSPVPLPATGLMLVSGLVGLWRLRRYTSSAGSQYQLAGSRGLP